VFTGIAPLVGVDQGDAAPLNQASPTVTPDGLTLYFVSGNDKIYYSTRSSSTAPTWSPPALLTGLSGFGPCDQAFVRGDGQFLYFASTGPEDGGALASMGGYDIYRIPLTAGMPGGNTEHIAELSSTGDDNYPVMTPDGLHAYLTRAVGGDGGPDLRQIWSVSRTSQSVMFGNASIVSELEYDLSDQDPTWISPDNCTLLFESRKADGQTDEIYATTRSQ
jgi:hypothetical protein